MIPTPNGSAAVPEALTAEQERVRHVLNEYGVEDDVIPGADRLAADVIRLCRALRSSLEGEG